MRGGGDGAVVESRMLEARRTRLEMDGKGPFLAATAPMLMSSQAECPSTVRYSMSSTARS
jgi:hypothetical protein